MPVWTDEDKKKVIAAYVKSNPTPETSSEIIKDLADETGFTANGIRMILVQAEVYVKKDTTSTSSKAKEGDKKPRVSKESQIASLKAALSDNGADVDEEILDKLTGKAAEYFTKVITQITKAE